MVSIYLVSHILVKRFLGHVRPQSEDIIFIVVNVAIGDPEQKRDGQFSFAQGFRCQGIPLKYTNPMVTIGVTFR